MKRKFRGFTLIEVIVVIAIIGVLAAILVPSMIGYIRKSKRTNDVSSARRTYNITMEIVVEDDELALSFYSEGNAFLNAIPKVDELSNENYDLCLVAYMDGSNLRGTSTVGGWMPFDTEHQEFCDAINAKMEFSPDSQTVSMPIKYISEGGNSFDRWFIGYRKNLPTQVEIWVGDGSTNTPLKCLYTQISREK